MEVGDLDGRDGGEAQVSRADTRVAVGGRVGVGIGVGIGVGVGGGVGGGVSVGVARVETWAENLGLEEPRSPAQQLESEHLHHTQCMDPSVDCKHANRSMHALCEPLESTSSYA